jgi:amidase
LRIGFLNHPLLDIGIDHPECRAAVDQTVKLLQQLGHEVEDSFPTAMTEPQFSDLFVGIITASLHADLSALEFLLGISFDETNLEPDNLFFREMGKAVSAADYINTVRLMHMWSRRMISWWKTPAMDSGEFDILVTPTLAAPAPEIGWLSGPDGGFHVQQILQYTAQFNITGQPALSLPLHMTPDGIPVGVQFVAAPNREDVLVRLASQIEAAAPWADRKAPNAI